MKNSSGPSNSMPTFSFDADLLHASSRIPSTREINVLQPLPEVVKRYRDDGTVEEADAVAEHGGEA